LRAISNLFSFFIHPVYWDQKTKGRGLNFHRGQANFSACPTAEAVGKAAIMSNRQLSALEDWNSVEQSGNSYKFGK
jgi:hypothetical protein